MAFVKLPRLGHIALVVAVLLASTPAIAADHTSVSATLVPTSTSDEPKASGVVKFQGDLIWNWYSGYSLRGDLTVTCRGLTPFATYRTPAGTFIADKSGTGIAKTRNGYFAVYFTVTVYREVTKDVAYVPVLEGILNAVPQ